MNAKINLSIDDKHHNLLRILRAVNYKELKHSATFGCSEIGILISIFLWLFFYFVIYYIILITI